MRLEIVPGKRALFDKRIDAVEPSGQFPKAALKVNDHGGSKRLELGCIAQKLDRVAGTLLGTKQHSAALKALPGPGRPLKVISAQERIFLEQAELVLFPTFGELFRRKQRQRVGQVCRHRRPLRQVMAVDGNGFVDASGIVQTDPYIREAVNNVAGRECEAFAVLKGFYCLLKAILLVQRDAEMIPRDGPPRVERNGASCVCFASAWISRP